MIKKRRGGLLLLLGFFLILLLSLPIIGFTAPVGNPATTDVPKGPGVFSMKQDKNLSIKTAVDFDFLFDKKIHADAATNTKFTSAQWYMVRLSYGMFNERVEPYIKLGMAHIKSQWTEGATDIKLESDNGFAWGLGTKALIYNLEKPKVKFIGDLFYRMADLDVEKGYVAGTQVTPTKSKSKFAIREWQFALLAATEIDVSGSGRTEALGVSKIVPYAGIKYSDLSGRLRLTQSDATFFNPGKLEAEHNIGIFAGCDILGTDSVLLNVEGRLIDETALSAGMAVLF